MKKDNLALITKEDIDQSGQIALNEKQLNLLLTHTPAQFVRQRPAKGGGEWSYVTGGYVKKVLNLLTGFRWSFHVVDKELYIEAKQVVVHGRLTLHLKDGDTDCTIIKEQFGTKDVMFRKNSSQPLNLGNDFKAAATDALKKCAADLGIAADVYNAEEFKEVRVVDANDMLNEIIEMYEILKDNIPMDQVENIDRIIANKEEKSYTKTLNFLKKMI
jgi:hypothetical protein